MVVMVVGVGQLRHSSGGVRRGTCRRRNEASGDSGWVDGFVVFEESEKRGELVEERPRTRKRH